VEEPVPDAAGCAGRRQKCIEVSKAASGIAGLPRFTFCSPHAKEHFSRTCSVWEHRETTRIASALSRFPQSTFVDLGTRSGWFATLAAAAGHPTLGVEPNLNSSCIAEQNFARNRLSARAKLFVHGADTRMHKMSLTGTAMHDAAEERQVNAASRTFTERTQTVTTIRLDSLAPFVSTRELVMKVRPWYIAWWVPTAWSVPARVDARDTTAMLSYAMPCHAM
jgi:hypothetical protein